MSGYTTDDIQTLDGIAHIRKRVRVYLGEQVRTTAAREVVDNACDEVERGHGTHVAVTEHPDGSLEVTDDGRGLPVDTKGGVNGIMLTLGTPNSGSNFDDSGTTAGTNGVGASATNAISARFDVTVRRGGKRYVQQFRCGRPGTFAGDGFDPDAAFTPTEGGALRGVKDDGPTGTTIRFIFDPAIEPDDALDTAEVFQRARITARLIEGMTLTLTDREGRTETFDGPYGARPVLELHEAAADASVDGSTEYTRGEKSVPVGYDVAFAVAEEPLTVAAVNGVYTPDGGSHVNAAVKAISETLAARKVRGLDLQKGESGPTAADFAATLALSVALRSPGATFVGQDKRSLRAVALGNALGKDLARQVSVWAASPANADTVGRWAKAALAHARTVRKVEAARASARKKNKAKGLGENLSLPEKLAPCRVTGRGSGAELFLGEGDSAHGTITAARSAEFQASFPLRGKPINAHGRALGSPVAPKGGTLRSNAEFAAIEAILGCGVRDKCDPEACNYDRIIFAADADPDGKGISALLIALFHSAFRPLLAAGMVYVSLPPLFIVTDSGTERIYCLDEAERDDAVESLRKKGRTGIEVQRCKGLGEMEPRDFRRTVMDPATRALIRIRLDDGAEDSLDTAFGPSAQARRDWIDHMRATGAAAEVDAVM